MIKVKYILISLIVFFISFVVIDGGRTVMFTGNNSHITLDHHHGSDRDIPDKHNFAGSHDDEKLIKTNSHEVLSITMKPVLFSCFLTVCTADYTGSIWQPPRFVRHLFPSNKISAGL